MHVRYRYLGQSRYYVRNIIESYVMGVATQGSTRHVSKHKFRIFFKKSSDMALSGIFRHPSPSSPIPSTRALYHGFIESPNSQNFTLDHIVPRL